MKMVKKPSIVKSMTKKAVFANEIKPPRCPLWLKSHARKMWKQIVESQSPDWFRNSDLPLLESYCLSYSQMRDASTTLEEEGQYTHNAAGTKILHPAYKIIHDCQSRMTSMAVKLRICPNARHSDNLATTASKKRSLASTQSSGANVRRMFSS